MKLGFLSTDLDQLETAKGLADECGETLQGWVPKDGPPDGRFDAVIYDLDRWAFDANQRELLVQALSAEPLARPVAVHSFNLSDEQVEALEANGVIVSRYLDADLFDELIGAMAAFQAVPEDRVPGPAVSAS